MTGITEADLRRITDLLVNASNEYVKPPIFIENQTIITEDKKVLIVVLNEGTDKPCKDKDVVIFLKNGANKRKVTNNEEILRLLSKGKNLYSDELPLNSATINGSNKDKFDEYFYREFKMGCENLG